MFPLDNSLAEDHPRHLSSGPGRTFEEMERIAVIGCGGSGKTTLSRRLGGLLELPVIHIDGHYWREVEGVRIESTPEQWRDTHRELVAGRRWVIDGMKLGVLEERLAAADTAIFLDLPTMTCLWGIVRRRLRFRGQQPPRAGRVRRPHQLAVHRVGQLVSPPPAPAHPPAAGCVRPGCDRAPQPPRGRGAAGAGRAGHASLGRREAAYGLDVDSLPSSTVNERPPVNGVGRSSTYVAPAPVVRLVSSS